MSSLKTAPVDEEITELDRVVSFRKTWLQSAGYNKRNARKIAGDLNTDWHFACDLRKKCHDEELCMRILYGS